MSEVVDLDSFLKEASKGNEDAYKFLRLFYNATCLWDDLVDKDRPYNDSQVDEVFRGLFFELSENKFYRDNQDSLSSFLFVVVNAWKDSNEWHDSKNKMQGLCAWFIRHLYQEVIPLIAWKVGGYKHARSISLKFRQFALQDSISRGMDGFFEKE